MSSSVGKPVPVVFSDLDGTFLTDLKGLPEANLRALKELERMGGLFVPATGRPLSGMWRELRELPAERFLIVTNGAAVVEMTGKDTSEPVYGQDSVPSDDSYRYLFRISITYEQVMSLYTKLKDLPIDFDVFGDGHAYTERSRYEILDTFGLHPGFLEQVRRSRTVIEDADWLDFLPTIKTIDRVSIYFHNSHERSRSVQAVEETPGLGWTSSEFCNLEIADANVNKARALVWLCDHMGWDPSNCIAFGDGQNDIEMLEAVGTGVAVGNAQPGVSSHADVTLPGTNADGAVGEYLLEWLKGWDAANA